MVTTSSVSISTPSARHLADSSLEQFLQLLDDDDYRRFVAQMEPLMVAARANSSGRQIAAVERHMCRLATNVTNDTTDIDSLPAFSE